MLTEHFPLPGHVPGIHYHTDFISYQLLQETLDTLLWSFIVVIFY